MNKTTCGLMMALAAASVSATAAPMRLAWSGRAVFDRELPFPADISFLPHGHYAAQVTSLPASLDIVDSAGRTVMSSAAPTNVAPPYVFHLALSCGHPASLFVTKDGVTRVVGTPLPPANVDLRATANRTGFKVVSRGGAGAVTATMSAGVGQADVRFVTRGPSGVPYCEDGRLYFTFSARYFGAHLGVGSIEVAHPERGWRFEGTILFDYGDGKLRNDLAAHLWLDPEANVWKAYVCNFSTSSAIDGLGGRAKGGVNISVSRESPLHGFHVLPAKSLDLDGMNEDPGAYYDAEAGKWRLFLSHFTPEGGIKACLLESDRWDGGFRPLTGIVPEDSTGTTIALMDGRPRCLTGSADRAYYIYAYPTLEKLGAIPLDVTPWGDNKGWPHGRGWPAYAETKLPDGSTRKIFLTMDRVNFPGMPKPNWTYGKLFIYVAASAREYWIAPDGTNAACTEASPGSLDQGLQQIQRGLGVATADFDSGIKLVLRDGTYAVRGRKRAKKLGPHQWREALYTLQGAGHVTVRSASGDASKCVLKGDASNDEVAFLFFNARGMRFDGVTFKGFRSSSGGSTVAANGAVLFDRCVFADCSSGTSAGAVERGVFTNCRFVGCSAAHEGGAASVGPGNSFTDCVFENCRAGKNGGALRLAGSYIRYPAITNCTFVGCRAEEGMGGAVYVTADARGRVPVVGCTFRKNFAPVRAPAERRETSLGWNAFPHAAAIVEKDCVYDGNFMCDYGSKSGPYVNSAVVRPGDDLKAVRDRLRAKRDPKAKAEVVFEDGVYELTNRLELTEWDSRTTWRARHPGKAFVVGGWSFRGRDLRPLAVFDPLAKRIPKEARGKVRTVAVPEYLRTNFVKHAFVGGMPVLVGQNGNYAGFDSNKKEIWGAKYPRHPVLSIDTHMMTPARWPNADNEDYFSPGTNMVVRAAKGVRPVVRVPGGRLARWQAEDADINVAGFLSDCIYATSRAAVTKVDPVAGTAEIADGGICPKSRFAFYNVMEEIDVPGEWCYDRKSGRLVVYPPEGFGPDSVCALGVSADSFFRVRGSDISIEGFKFTAKHSHPAVILEGGERNRLVGCRFSGLEYEAVYMSGRYCRVQSCDFEELNAAGIRVTGGSGVEGTRGRNLVENCRFRDFCRMKNSWATGGVLLAGGAGNALRHCEISDSIEHGLDYFGFGHLVEYNRIYDCSYQFGDSGAVYSKGGSVSYGCTFRYNDVSAAPGYVHAIYYDDTTSGHRIYGNICRGYGCYGIFIGGGRDNLVSNNLVCASTGLGIRFDERGLFWPAYFGQNLTNILNRLKRDYRLGDPTSPMAKSYPAFAASLKDPDARWAAPVGNVYVNNLVLDVGGAFYAAQEGKGIRIKPGEYVSEGNLGVRSAGAKRGGDVWYLGGVKTLYGTKENPIDLGFVDIPKVEKKTKRRYVWKKGDFNLKPDARLSAEMPQFRPIPWDRIGLYNDDWRKVK